MAGQSGQPTLLTPEMIEDVKRILPTVMYMETVGDYLGVSRQTWRGWIRRGRKEYNRIEKARKAENKEPLEREALYLQFFAAIKKALAEGEIFDAGVIKKAASEQWQAAAWRLERRFPDRWGRKDTSNVNLRNLDRAIEAELEAVAARSQAPLPGGTAETEPANGQAEGVTGAPVQGPSVNHGERGVTPGPVATERPPLPVPAHPVPLFQTGGEVPDGKRPGPS